MSDQQRLQQVIDACSAVILGKQKQIKQALCCLLAKGHLLIEDIPGVGKTTLAHTLAQVMGLQYQRVQFTSDLLPGDVLGGAIFDKQNGEFIFHAGPIFNQLVLADEINRASPKTQSALLEAMEERQVSIEGKTRQLPEPFFVIATQNPLFQVGTFPLPESQLDRFLMRIHIGYPDKKAERELLQMVEKKSALSKIPLLLPEQVLLTLQQQVEQVVVSDAIVDYVQAIIKRTREDQSFHLGLSPRAGLALIACAKSWAYIEQRNFVIPEDIQTILPAVAGHRIVHSESSQLETQHIIKQLIGQVPVL